MKSRWPIWMTCTAAGCGLVIHWYALTLRRGAELDTNALTKPNSKVMETTSAEPDSNPMSTSPPSLGRRIESLRTSAVVENTYQLLSRHASPSHEAASQVAQMTPDQLKEAVQSTNTTLQVAAAFAIGRQPTPVLADRLLEAASTAQDGRTRTALLTAVTTMHSEDCILELVARLGLNKDGDVQEAAATALLRSGSPDVVNALIGRAEANSRDERLCHDIGTTLARIRNSAATENLLSGINSPVPAVVAGCVSAISVLDEPAAVEAMAKQLKTRRIFDQGLSSNINHESGN